MEVAKIPRTPKWESQKSTNLSNESYWPHNSSLKVLIKNISSDKLSPFKRTFPNTYCTIKLEVF
jgi:hypothetical protein